MLRVLLLAAFLPALAFAQTPVTACTGTGRPLPIQVRVPGCTVPMCTFVQGTTYVTEVDFIAVLGGLSLTVDVWVSVANIHVNYELPIEHRDGCANLAGASCPLGFNQAATHLFEFTINPAFPPGLSTIEVSLINHNGDTVYCAVLNGNVIT